MWYTSCVHAGKRVPSALHVVLNDTEEDQSSARLGNTHKKQGAFMHFPDPSLSPPFAVPSPCHDSMINHQTHNRGTCPRSLRPAPSDLYILIRIRQEVNNEWRSPSGAANSILLCVTFHSGLFTTLCLNIRYNPLIYQRWTNHINLDIASAGPGAHYVLDTEPQPHHLLCPPTCLWLTPQWTFAQLTFLFISMYSSSFIFDVFRIGKKNGKYRK